VIVDPDRKWKDGDHVVVSKRGTDVVLVKEIRQAVRVVGKISDRGILPDASVLLAPSRPSFLLVSINEKYRAFLMRDDMTILGVVVDRYEDEPS
jgi:SOS-response transcriptional repressor LexA